MNLDFLTQFINANKIGGWTRAIVAAGIGSAIAKWPLLATYLDPTVQQALGVAAAGIVVGLWSQLTKTDTAKLSMAAAIPGPAKEAAFAGIPDSAKIAAVTALPDVEKLVVQPNATDGVGAALKDPAQPKVVSS